MKKILSIIIVLVLILYMVYKIDTVNRTKAKIIDITTTLMDSISSQDYEKIKIYLKHADGTELTDEEISNFLLNTGLYRATLVEDETFLYDTNISFWNIHKGKILFSFIALNGENISNTFADAVNGKDTIFGGTNDGKLKAAIKSLNADNIIEVMDHYYTSEKNKYKYVY